MEFKHVFGYTYVDCNFPGQIYLWMTYTRKKCSRNIEKKKFL